MLVAVVDDDEGVCRSVARMLRAYGFEIVSFLSADEFLKSSRVPDVTCLVLDVRMPGQSGLELQKLLRVLGYSIPIIFITGYLDAEIGQQALRDGAFTILEKPFDDQLLINKIKEAVVAHPL